MNKCSKIRPLTSFLISSFPSLSHPDKTTVALCVIPQTLKNCLPWTLLQLGCTSQSVWLTPSFEASLYSNVTWSESLLWPLQMKEKHFILSPSVILTLIYIFIIEVTLVISFCILRIQNTPILLQVLLRQCTQRQCIHESSVIIWIDAKQEISS